MDGILRNRLKIIVILGVSLVALGLIAFILSPQYKGFSIHKTPYLGTGFTAIQGQSIYDYNGLSFYKSPLNDPTKITTLSSGFQLPLPSTVYWAGDEGAVLTFTDQGATGSLLESELQSRGLELDNRTMEFVWYFDFSSRSLRLVDEFGFASPAYYYSPEKQGFYYIKRGKPVTESHGFENAALTFYSLKSFNAETASPSAGDEEAVTYIGACRDGTSVCLIKDIKGKQSLYAIEDTRQIKIGESYDHLTPTSSSVIFVGSIYDTPESSEDAEDELLRSSYYVLDSTTGKQSRVIDDVVANSSFIANTNDDESFYIFEPTPESSDNEISFYTGAKNILGTPKAKKVKFSNDTKKSGIPSSVAVFDLVTRNGSGFMIFRDVDAVYLVTPQDYKYVSLKQSPQTLEASLQPCFSKYTQYHDFTEELNQLKVGITFDDNYRKNIEAFSSCVADSSPRSQVGHDFVFVGLSPIDGRFVTN